MLAASSRALTKGQVDELAELGLTDTTTPVEVSIMIYYTAEFAAEFDSQVSFDGFMEEASVLSNLVLLISNFKSF